MIAHYRKLPVVIEAVKLTPETFDEAVDWIGNGDALVESSFDHCTLTIQTLEGDMKAGQGDWVIRGVKGEFYPCKTDIFEQTYEIVTN